MGMAGNDGDHAMTDCTSTENGTRNYSHRAAAAAALEQALELRDRGALFIVSHSGGKDSQAMLAFVRQHVADAQIVVVHADLPGMDWPGTFAHVEATTADGIEVRRCQAIHADGTPKTFETMVERRGMFPNPKLRTCTSDLKRGPLEVVIRRISKERGELLIVDCEGIRSLESARRSKGYGTKAAPVAMKAHNKLSKAGREVYKWAPIFDLAVDEVFETIAAAGQEPHPAYALGMDRLSCALCIMSSPAQLRRGAELNPATFRMLAELEARVGHTMMTPRKGTEPKTLPEITGIVIELDALRIGRRAVAEDVEEVDQVVEAVEVEELEGGVVLAELDEQDAAAAANWIALPVGASVRVGPYRMVVLEVGPAGPTWLRRSDRKRIQHRASFEVRKSGALLNLFKLDAGRLANDLLFGQLRTLPVYGVAGASGFDRSLGVALGTLALDQVAELELEAVTPIPRFHEPTLEDAATDDTRAADQVAEAVRVEAEYQRILALSYPGDAPSQDDQAELEAEAWTADQELLEVRPVGMCAKLWRRRDWFAVPGQPGAARRCHGPEFLYWFPADAAHVELEGQALRLGALLWSPDGQSTLVGLEDNGRTLVVEDTASSALERVALVEVALLDAMHAGPRPVARYHWTPGDSWSACNHRGRHRCELPTDHALRATFRTSAKSKAALEAFLAEERAEALEAELEVEVEAEVELAALRPSRTVYLVACSGTKADEALEARDLYRGDLFRKSRAYVEALGAVPGRTYSDHRAAPRAADAAELAELDVHACRCVLCADEADTWFVLSAKHRALAPDRVVEPYDQRPPTKADDRRRWASWMWRELPVRPGDRVVVLAGVAYRRDLVPLLEASGAVVEVPLEGLGIGEQRHRLAELLEELEDQVEELEPVAWSTTGTRLQGTTLGQWCDAWHAIQGRRLSAARYAATDSHLRDLPDDVVAEAELEELARLEGIVRGISVPRGRRAVHPRTRLLDAIDRRKAAVRRADRLAVQDAAQRAFEDDRAATGDPVDSSRRRVSEIAARPSVAPYALLGALVERLEALAALVRLAVLDRAALEQSLEVVDLVLVDQVLEAGPMRPRPPPRAPATTTLRRDAVRNFEDLGRHGGGLALAA